MSGDKDPDLTPGEADPDGVGPRPDEDPIDADFEPVPPRESEKPENKTAGPGWLGVGVASTIAAGVGGLIGVVASGMAGQGSSVSSDLYELVENQRATEARVEDVAGEITAAEARIQRDVQALLAGDGDSAGLEALVEDLEALSARLDEAGAASVDGDTLSALAARVETLETADDNEAVSPRQMNRAVTALRERVDGQETVLAEIRRGLDIRADALAGLTTRIAAVELGIEGESGDAMVALEAQIEALRADLDTLREAGIGAAGLEAALAAQEAASNAAVAQAADRAEAALALASIQSRARRGLAFEAPLAKLQAAMPDNSAVAALAPIADTGAPTIEDIRAGFSDARAAATTTDQGSDDGWNWVRNVFGDAVTVRQDGDTGSVAASLDAIETALSSGDITTAIDGAERLDGAAGEALSDWLDGARKRRDLEAALESLNLAMLRAEP